MPFEPSAHGDASASRQRPASGAANFFQLFHARTNAAPANIAASPAAA